jgi:hypothetical protein
LPCRVVVRGKGKMVLGIQPSVVSTTEALEGANIDHLSSPLGKFAVDGQ